MLSVIMGYDVQCDIHCMLFAGAAAGAGTAIHILTQPVISCARMRFTAAIRSMISTINSHHLLAVNSTASKLTTIVAAVTTSSANAAKPCGAPPDVAAPTSAAAISIHLVCVSPVQ
jgi:hypothetical protein